MPSCPIECLLIQSDEQMAFIDSFLEWIYISIREFCLNITMFYGYAKSQATANFQTITCTREIPQMGMRIIKNEITYANIWKCQIAISEYVYFMFRPAACDLRLVLWISICDQHNLASYNKFNPSEYRNVLGMSQQFVSFNWKATEWKLILIHSPHIGGRAWIVVHRIDLIVTLLNWSMRLFPLMYSWNLLYVV